MNEHQKRLCQKMIDLIQAYLNKETEDFYSIVGQLEGNLDASEIKDLAFINQWYDSWSPLEARRAIEGHNVNRIKSEEELNLLKKFLLSKIDQL